MADLGQCPLLLSHSKAGVKGASSTDAMVDCAIFGRQVNLDQVQGNTNWSNLYELDPTEHSMSISWLQRENYNITTSCARAQTLRFVVHDQHLLAETTRC